MAKVTIDVAGMGRVVSGLESGIERINDAKASLRSTLDRFDVSSGRVWAIGRAATWAEGELPGVRRRLAMAQALEGTKPEWPHGIVEFDEGDISTMSPEAAQKAGEEAALALREGGARPDDDLVEQILENSNDPYFAAGFAGAMSAEELAAVVVRLQYGRTPMDGRLTYDEVTAANAWYAELLTGMSQTLATATRSTGDLALPDGYAASWVAEITREVPTQHPYEGDGIVDHANALGVLLMQGRFGTDFLGTVAEGVYDYEREFGAEHGAVWAPRSSDGTGTFVQTADGMRFADPLAGIMAALGNNPEAAQDFFSGGDEVTVEVDGADVQVSDRLRYLVVERTWAVDPTNGGTLGSALEAATTTFRDRTSRGRVSAEIAAQTFALIGAETGRGKDWKPGDEGWEMWDGMRPHVAEMVSSFSSDLYRTITEGTGSPADGWVWDWSDDDAGQVFPADMPYGARLDLDLMEKVIGTLGEDKANIEVVLAGMTAAANLSMQTRFGNGYFGTDAGRAFLQGEENPLVTNAVLSGAEALGWVVRHGYEGDKADEATEAARRKFVADMLSTVASLPVVPKVPDQTWQWILDQGRTRALDAYRQGPPATASGVYSTIDEKLPRGVVDNVMNLLLQTGYLDEAAYAAANEAAGAPPGSEIFVAPPPGAIVPGSNPPVFDVDSEEYRSWLERYGPNGFLQNSVADAYNSQFGNVP